MSTISRINVAYGFTQSLLNEVQQPIVSLRAPTVKDKAQLGTTWVNKVANTAYILTSVVNNSSSWEEIGGGAAGVNTVVSDAGSATASAGSMTFAGGSNINTSATANTVTINLDNTVSISGSMTAGTGLTTTTGDVTITAGNINMARTNAGGTEGVINLSSTPYIHNYGPGFSDNVFMGFNAGAAALAGGTSAVNATGIGDNALGMLTTGDNNSAFGSEALASINTGIGNCAFGALAGEAYSSSESYNIIIGANVVGTTGESNIIRIGTNGSSAFEQNTCYIAGIQGNSVSNPQLVTIDSLTGQLGVTASVSGVTWSVVTGSTNLVAGNGYIVNSSAMLEFTLPVTAAVGDTFQIATLDTAGDGWQVNQNSGQYIVSNRTNSDPATVTTTGTGGNIATSISDGAWNSATIVCGVANTVFILTQSGLGVIFT